MFIWEKAPSLGYIILAIPKPLGLGECSQVLPHWAVSQTGPSVWTTNSLNYAYIVAQSTGSLLTPRPPPRAHTPPPGNSFLQLKQEEDLHLCLSEAMQAACPPSQTTVCLPKFHGATPLAPHHLCLSIQGPAWPRIPARITPFCPLLQHPALAGSPDGN